MSEILKQELTSMNIKEAQLEKLKSIFPEVFTEGLKVDWEKLKLTLGESVDVGKERYGMMWPGKAECFKTIQEPSIGTLIPCREESIDFDNTQNLFIEGDNLEVLKLLQRSYIGKVKIIYIDPPYNTGKEFIYPDNYSESLDTYLEYTGQIDSSGKKYGTNTDKDGRFHSKWINMIFPRLMLAKNLLKEDGVLFISIDDNEVATLKLLCNEIFGEDNFVEQFIIRSNPRGNQAKKLVASEHEYILCYIKNKEKALPLGFGKDVSEYKKKDEVGIYREIGLRKRGAGSLREDAPNQFYEIFYNEETGKISTTSFSPSISIIPKLSTGEEGRWRWAKSTVESNTDKLLIRSVKRGNTKEYDVFEKDYFTDDKISKIKSIFYEKDVNNENATEELKGLFKTKVFDYPKPVYTIKKIIEAVNDDNAIVLDFFSGTSTTAQAVIELNKIDGGNRKFICVQIPEPIENDSDTPSSFKNIADFGKERIRKVISKVKSELVNEVKLNSQNLFINNSSTDKSFDLGFRVFKLSKSNFKIWDNTLVSESNLIQYRLFNHIEHVGFDNEKESVLFELLLKSGFQLITKIEKIYLCGKTVFLIEDGQLIVCLEDEITHECLMAIAEMQPVRVICLDSSFRGPNADALKTNAVQIMKSKGVVNFRTI